MRTKYDVHDLGKLNWLLGIKVTQNSRGVSLSQEKYVNDLLSRFRMTDCHPSATPADSNVTLSKAQEPQTKEEEVKMSPEILEILEIFDLIEQNDYANKALIKNKIKKIKVNHSAIMIQKSKRTLRSFLFKLRQRMQK